MATTQIDSPNWFDNDYLNQNFDVSRNLSEDEINDLYGFVDGILDNGASEPSQVTESLEQENYTDEVNKFADVVDEESLRYRFKGEKGSPDHLGKCLAGHRESRSSRLTRESTATKNPNPENSSFTSGRKVNIDRLEKQGELNDSVHYDVREEQDEVKLILNGEVKDLHSDRIELSSSRYQDLTLDELGGEYGEPFGEEIASLERGEIESDGSENLSSISTVIYDDIVAE